MISTSTRRDNAAEVAAFMERVPTKSVLSAQEAGRWLEGSGADAVVAPDCVEEVPAANGLGG